MPLQRFLDLVIASGLANQEGLDRAMDALRAAEGDFAINEAQSLPRLTEWLVSAGVLTQWQCEKLLEGKYKGFFLGKYRLLKHLASGKTSARYLAVNGDNNELVEIIVHPPAKAAAFYVIQPGSLLDEDDEF